MLSGGIPGVGKGGGGAKDAGGKNPLVKLDTAGLKKILELQSKRPITLNGIQSAIASAENSFRGTVAAFNDKLAAMEALVNSNLNQYANKFDPQREGRVL